MAVDWHATLGHASPIIESNHIALMHSGKEASWPCSPVLAPFWQSHHPVFQALQWPLQPRASSATTTIIIITIIKTRHTTAAQWPTCSPAPASAKEWHFAASPRLCVK